jgi:hypothetical protein
VDKLITDADISRNLSGRWKTKASKSLLLENIMSNFLLEAGRQTLMLELQEASRLPERLGDDFIRAAETIIHCEGKLVVSRYR